MGSAYGNVGDTKNGEVHLKPYHAKLDNLTMLQAFSDGIILHCHVSNCEKIAYTVTGGSALCWTHFKKQD